MEREEELEQTIDELNYRLTNALIKIDRLKSNIKQAREGMTAYIEPTTGQWTSGFNNGVNTCIEILDGLIAESEG